MKSVLAEIGEEIAENEKKKILDKGVEMGVENGLRIAIDNAAVTRFNKRSRRLNADISSSVKKFRKTKMGGLHSSLSCVQCKHVSEHAELIQPTQWSGQAVNERNHP